MIDLSEKSLIAEDDVRAAPVGATLRIGERALVTPLAADLARERHIRLERLSVAAVYDRRENGIGADHGGFEMKGGLKGFLTQLGIQNTAFVTHSTDPCDYP